MNGSALKEMLKTAIVYVNRSIEYFNWMQDAQDQNDHEMEENYWAQSQEYAGRAYGMLKAYEILTGRPVIAITSAIQDELEIFA